MIKSVSVGAGQAIPQQPALCTDGAPASGSALGLDTPDRAARLDDADRAGHAGAVVGAVPVRVLGVGQVLLVVVLSEVKLRGRADLRADRAVTGVGQPLLVRGR